MSAIKIFFNGSFNCRCLVPECESLESSRYNEDWVKNILPGTTSVSGVFQPDVCKKYVFRNESDTTTRLNGTCPAEWFSPEEERCDKWVFDENERTIVNDVS